LPKLIAQDTPPRYLFGICLPVGLGTEESPTYFLEIRDVSTALDMTKEQLNWKQLITAAEVQVYNR